jgi:hypothetical protein
MENIKYNCDKCNFKCNTKARWEAHLNTELHKTGQRKKRCDFKEPYKCDKCDYESKNLTTFNIHKLNYHSTIEEREKDFKYYCKECDYGCFYEDAINKHNETIKHKYNIFVKNK